jgi:hypothetical protein
VVLSREAGLGRRLTALVDRGHAGSAHRVPWLPAVPRTNPDAVELYVWTSVPPEYLPAHGLLTTDVFLLARLDLDRLAHSQRTGWLLCLTVAAGRAVDLLAHARQLPERLLHRVREASDTYLVPLAWLPDVEVSAVYELDGRGGHARMGSWTGAELTVRFAGADHGVPGLPNDVVRWPTRPGQSRAYLTLPEDARAMVARLASHPGWLPLHRRRPNPARGHRLVDVGVDRHRAIDVAATLAVLADAPVVGSSLYGFIGSDLALPATEFPRTPVLNGRHPSEQTLAQVVVS